MRIEKKKQKSLKKFLNLLVDMIIQIKDNNGIEYEIKHINKFAKHIFQFHSIGFSLHQQNGYNFTVDDVFREKVTEFIKKEKI